MSAVFVASLFEEVRAAGVCEAQELAEYAPFGVGVLGDMALQDVPGVGDHLAG